MAIIAIGVDLAKNVFAVHGVDETGKAVLIKPSVHREALLELMAKMPPCVIGMEACSGAHHWARQFQRFGHTVRIIAAKFVAPYRLSGRKGKNDAAHAQAICEAVQRPHMRFVPIKSEDAQGHAFSEAIKSCGTGAVTRKTTELYDAHVTDELRTAFAKELETLGIRGQPVTLEMTGQKGARVQQLKLGTMPRFAKAKLSAILSEGEQRVVALALFLAEIGMEPGRSGLIFDDPVSSLDHLRRERIARRLVLEAKKRQVIVFTHDLAFALALTDFAEDQGVKFAHRHLAATIKRKGLCSDDLPFEGKKLKNRVGDLRALATHAKNLLERDGNVEGYNDAVRSGYRRLRDTWEQLVEDVLLQSTVRRYRVSVETTRLKSVSVDDTDASAVYNGMTRCSKFTHEGGAEAPPALPEPVEFAADVEELAAYAKTVEDRAKATEARRKLAGFGA